MKLKIIPKPIYAQCNICWKKYDMIEWGVQCPSCNSNKDDEDKKGK